MPTRTLTPVEESFCRAYVEGNGNAADAYCIANPKAKNWKRGAVYPKASVLLAQDKIKVRIAEIRAAAAKSTEITLMDIAKMLQDAAEVGRAGGDASAMTEAAMSLAKLLGHYTEKRHVSSDNRNHNVEERVSPTSEWIAGVLGSAEKASPPKSRQN